ncbi:GNAT family N-acetyltransferase [Candidatus Nitrospira bockiana]
MTRLLDRLAVRRAQEADVATLVRFSAAMAQETEGRSLDQDRLEQGTRAVIRTPAHGFYLVAEHRDGPRSAVVGQLLVTYEWSDWRNGVFWWIQSVYVDRAWRRRGVYRRLYDSVLSEARGRKDVCGLRLYVEQDNAVAQQVYRTLGLTPTTYRVWEVDFVL